MTLRLNGSTSGYTEIDAPAVAGNNTFVLPSGNGSSGQFLQTDGSGALSWASGGGGFESGTTTLFVQTNAPTGWTKSTTHNDKALRVVSGAAGSGGSTAFTSVFTSRTPSGTVGATTLTTTQMPSHTHSVNRGTSVGTFQFAAAGGTAAATNTTAAGGGGSHDHSFTGSAMDFAVQYVDVIIAVKD